MISPRVIDESFLMASDSAAGGGVWPSRSSRSASTFSRPVVLNLNMEGLHFFSRCGSRCAQRRTGLIIPVDRSRVKSPRLGAARSILTVGLVAAMAVCLSAAGCQRPAGEVRRVYGSAARAKPFVGSAMRSVYHRSDCRHARRIPDGNLVGYDTAADAESDGRRPCRVCRPDREEEVDDD